MSGKVYGRVFDRYDGSGGELVLALAIADCADPDGTSIYPSVGKLAKMTRQSERQVQRQLAVMVKKGWLILVKAESRAHGRPREYRINPAWFIDPIAENGDENTQSPGDKMSPGEAVHNSSKSVDNNTAPGDKMSPGTNGHRVTSDVTRPGDIAMSPNLSDTRKSKRGEDNPPASQKPRAPPVALIASAAWAEVGEALRRGAKPPTWTYPLTERVLTEIGGFHQLSQKPSREIGFVGNDFKAIFKLRAMTEEQTGRAA